MYKVRPKNASLVCFVLFCFFYKRQHIVNVSPSRQPVPIMPISMRALGLHTITTTCYRVLHNYKTAKIAKNIVWNSLQLAYSPDELQFRKCAATISRLARLIFDSRALYSAHESK